MRKITSYGPSLMTEAELKSMRELANDYGVSVSALMADREEELSYLREEALERAERDRLNARRAAKDVVRTSRAETQEAIEYFRDGSPLWKLANRLTALVGLSVDIICTGGVYAGGQELTVSVHSYEVNEATARREHVTEVVGYAHQDENGVIRFRTEVGSSEFIGISGVVQFIAEHASRADFMPTAHVMKAAKKSGHGDSTGERATPGSEQGSERTSIARPSRQGERGMTEAERRASGAARWRRWAAKRAAALGAAEEEQARQLSAAAFLPNLRTIDNR